MPLEHEGEFRAVQCVVAMCEADATLEPRIAGHTLFDPGHADQDHADPATVEQVTYIPGARVRRALGLADHQQLDRGKPTDNAFAEVFNGKVRAECIDQNWFLSIEKGPCATLICSPMTSIRRLANVVLIVLIIFFVLIRSDYSAEPAHRFRPNL
ncbi:integrase core domain-containing protein [Palleronia rufa]|uniref:integrase core domain-containing protein n=1 Tax=Palleronia rufa TaxID=1530186 RepID=UPI0009DF16AD